MSDEIVDVLIIGAGAAGAAAALSLAETRMQIVCMEQGGWMDTTQYPSTRDHWELMDDGEYGLSPNTRGRPEDYPINDSESPISISNFNAVGGGTILYAAHFPRFHPSDFRVKTLDGVGDDWPIDYDTLKPYNEENDVTMGVSGLSGDPAYPAKKVTLPPVPLCKIGETVARGFNNLGWHWWPSDTAIATRDFQGRAACANLGPCITGCAQGAKASTDVTHWPEAIRRRVTLRTHCRVREITVGDDGMADGVIYYDEDGNECRQRAQVIVLACNGVGTPRLLLNSRSKLFPDGLANSSGLVGKNLMLHPYAMIRGVFDEPLEGYKGPMGCCLMSHEFYETDPARDFVRGYSFQMLRGMGPAETALWGMLHRQLNFGRDHHANYASLYDRTAGMVAICEDLPEICNSVTIDPELVDSNGIPAPKINYRLSENSKKMLHHAFARGR